MPVTEFDWSRHQSADELEAYRSFRFREEWRPLLLQYMGVAAGMRVLEVGCRPVLPPGAPDRQR